MKNLPALVAEIDEGPRPPLDLARTPAPISRPAPGLGEHTDEVLAELGIRADERARLRSSGAIA